MRTRFAIVVAIVGIVAAGAAVRLFPRAFPAIALDNRLTQGTALARADSFFAAHDLAAAAGRRAVHFSADDSLLTYVDLAAGGTDSVNALVRGADVALFSWTVRAFEPGDVHEARVELGTDGRVVGFRRKLANADTLPAIAEDSATALARVVLAEWIGESPDRWKVTATSYQTRKESGRVDRTVTFERTDRRIGAAPLRLDVVVAGNLPVEARPYIHVPESFSRRYAEMRSANDLLATFATLGILGLGLLGAFALRKFSRRGGLRWRGPIVVGGVVGALLAGAGMNAMGAAWFGYDTALPEGIYQALILAGALAGGVATGAVATLTLVAAESAARHAFPGTLDWWQLWRARGTREVAAQVGGGYVVAAIGFAYVALFYSFTRHALGWWVPSELLDDPNQIATPLPWLSGIAFSLQAGVWEESLFRALPLSLLALWVGNRAHRDWWMRAGVVGTALVFGFAHSSYPSWPPYSRGFELFLEASLWAVLFLRAGLLVTVLAHFVYDLVLFSLFTSTGSALEYRVSAGVALAALLAPALVVGWRFVRQRGFVPLPEGVTFGAWRPTAEAIPAAPPPAPAIAPLSPRSRQIAIVAAVGALIAVVAVPAGRTRGPAFTAGRREVIAVADSMLRTRTDSSAQAVLRAVGDPSSGWRRLVRDASDTLASWPRFLEEHDLDSLADTFARSYVVPAWWTVRYVRTTGGVADRAEEWRLRVFPDGRPLDVRHIVADSAPGVSPPADTVRRLARLALASAGFDTSRFAESDFETEARVHRKDATVTYTDTTVRLPAGAAARAWVSFAGDEPLVVRRGIALPESFRRAERERRTGMFAMAGLWFAIMFAALVTGAVFVARRRAPLVSDKAFERGTALALLGVLSAALVAGALNHWPSVVFGYDTATPWANHLAMSAISVAVAPIGALMMAGGWQLMEMVRRRTGIPAWPQRGHAEAVRDATLAGLGLGAVAALVAAIPEFAAESRFGAVPVTTLNHLLPQLDRALAVPFGVAADVAFGAIPLLLLLAVARTPRTRWLLLALVIALTTGILGPVVTALHAEPINPTRAAASLVLVVALALAVMHWARLGVYTWLVAALVTVVLSEVQAAVHARTDAGRVGAVLAILMAIVAFAWLARRAGPMGRPPVAGTPTL